MQQNYLIKDYQHHLLVNSLSSVFGDFDQSMLTLIEPQLEWIELAGGEILFEQDETDDALYFVISGRLRAFITTPEGEHITIGEIIRGETVGEMALFTGEPRGASIVATRDSVLVKLTKELYEKILKAYPLISMSVSKIIINRLRNSQSLKKTSKKPVNICFVDISRKQRSFIDKLFPYLERKSRTLLLSSDLINHTHETENLAQAAKNDTTHYRKLSQWLDEQESKHDLMLYLCDNTNTEWTQRCIRNADELYLIASADESPNLTDFEKDIFYKTQARPVIKNLILLHDEQTVIPHFTENWLKPRNVQRHFHIRPHLITDLQRLARVISGNAIGLVLAGGGAKGFAHLGVYQALKEFNIPIDFVGGTSVGAMMSSLVAFDISPEEAKSNARRGAFFNPTKDYTLLPFVSLIKGHRIEKMISDSIVSSVGKEVNIEDTWIPCYFVSSNFTEAREVLHTKGSITKYLRASSSIPGVFPPVIDNNDFLVDGGTFNNFPTDIMNKLGVAKIIGVDFFIDKPNKLSITKMPSGWEILKDRFRSKKDQKYRIPLLMSIILNSTVLYSDARQSETKKYTDLYINPDLRKYSILNWQAFDEIYEIGYQHAKQIFENMSEEELRFYRE